MNVSRCRLSDVCLNHTSMPHLRKRTTTGTTWEYQRWKDVADITNVQNINSTLVLDWGGYMRHCPCKTEKLDVDEHLFWSHISVANLITIDVTILYILKYFYSRHIKAEFHSKGETRLLRVFYEFYFTDNK